VKIFGKFGFGPKDRITYVGLRRFNLLMAGLHATQGIIVLWISNPTRGLQPISTNYLALDNNLSTTNHPVLVQSTRHLFDLNLAYLVAAFFFISAIAHLVIATIYRNRYEQGLKQGINRARWIEYSFSASIMMVGIALLSGIFDLSTLILIFTLDAVMNLMGWAMEIHRLQSGKTRWFDYWVGVLAGAVPWVVFSIYVWGAASYGSGVPGFVYWIYGSIFLFFSSFAINMALQYKKVGRWKNYLFGERTYIVLSLVAKSALAWQIFAGTLRP
jgi:hypothetical protein